MKRIFFFILAASGGILNYSPMFAADLTGGPVKLIVPIQGETSVSDPTAYFGLLFQYAIGLAALLALAMLVYGAVQYTASAGFPALQENAKSRIRGALFGLVLLLASITILTTLGSSGASDLKLSIKPLPTAPAVEPTTPPDLTMDGRIRKEAQEYAAIKSEVTTIFTDRDFIAAVDNDEYPYNQKALDNLLERYKNNSTDPHPLTRNDLIISLEDMKSRAESGANNEKELYQRSYVLKYFINELNHQWLLDARIADTIGHYYVPETFLGLK